MYYLLLTNHINLDVHAYIICYLLLILTIIFYYFFILRYMHALFICY